MVSTYISRAVYASILESSPLAMSFLMPIQGSGPSLDPPTYLPLTQTLGTELLEVLAWSSALCSLVASTTTGWWPLSRREERACAQYGQPVLTNTTISPELMILSIVAKNQLNTINVKAAIYSSANTKEEKEEKVTPLI